MIIIIHQNYSQLHLETNKCKTIDVAIVDGGPNGLSAAAHLHGFSGLGLAARFASDKYYRVSALSKLLPNHNKASREPGN